MSARSNLISKLQSDFKTRVAYIQAKVSTLVPSQIRALRLKSEMPRQPDLARAAEMHQSRISMLEAAGTNPTVSTLSAIAAALKVGLKIEFVPFSEMLAWENSFSQDQFDVVKIDDDLPFLNPAIAIQSQPVLPRFPWADSFQIDWSLWQKASLRLHEGVRIPVFTASELTEETGSEINQYVLMEPPPRLPYESRSVDVSFSGYEAISGQPFIGTGYYIQ